ncbi:hypothetical protein, partial [Cellulomonas marina]|uniref:hypothetical protein n=1 Tax=Cellulomonas marina TaxID=988821 RepID=UPI001944AF21
SHINPADTSATDGWELTVVGSPLAPVPDETAAYTYSDQAHVGLQLSKRREYWLSRRHEQQLE